MSPLVTLRGYFAWHYSRGYADLWYVLGNLLWFLTQFFSFTFLLKTLVAPWHRLGEERSKEGFSLRELGEVIIVNTLMRLVGLLMRLIVLIVGVVVYLLALIAAGIALVVWAVLPFGVVLVAAAGVTFLFL